jgi:hypothetical protein
MRRTGRISRMSGSARLCHSRAARPLRVTTPSRSLDPITSHIFVAVGLPGRRQRRPGAVAARQVLHARRSHELHRDTHLGSVPANRGGDHRGAARRLVGGVAGIMLGFGISYAVVTGAWNPERATSGAPARPATGAALGPRTVGYRWSTSDTRGYIDPQVSGGLEGLARAAGGAEVPLQRRGRRRRLIGDWRGQMLGTTAEPGRLRASSVWGLRLALQPAAC